MPATLDLGRLLPGVGRGGHPSCADDDPCSSEPLPASASSRHDTSPVRAAAAHWGGTTPVDENAPTDTGSRDAMSTVPECQDGLGLRWWSSMTSVSCLRVFGLSANAASGCPDPGIKCEVGIRHFRDSLLTRDGEDS